MFNKKLKADINKVLAKIDSDMVDVMNRLTDIENALMMLEGCSSRLDIIDHILKDVSMKSTKKVKAKRK